MKSVYAGVSSYIRNEKGVLRIANILIVLHVLLYSGILFILLFGKITNGLVALTLFMFPLFLLSGLIEPLAMCGILWSFVVAGKKRRFRKAAILFLLAAAPWVATLLFYDNSDYEQFIAPKKSSVQFEDRSMKLLYGAAGNALFSNLESVVQSCGGRVLKDTW